MIITVLYSIRFICLYLQKGNWGRMSNLDSLSHQAFLPSATKEDHQCPLDHLPPLDRRLDHPDFPRNDILHRRSLYYLCIKYIIINIVSILGNYNDDQLWSL